MRTLHSHLANPPKSAAQNNTIASLIAADAATQWRAFLHGLWLYQHHPQQRIENQWDIVAQTDAVALKILRSASSGQKRPPVLLVPSLINRFHILDLHPDHSFAQDLQQRGYDVYLIDWHHDPTQPLPQSLASCVTDYLLPLQARINKRHHVIGYCMGGTLSVAAAVIDAQYVQSLTLMATPWDFHQPSRDSALQFARLLHGFGNSTPDGHISSEWLQMLFWQRDPLAALRKFQTFAATAHTSQSMQFVLAEDWLNGGIDLPTSFLHDCATQWFENNQPSTGQWTIHGQTMDLRRLANVPIHLVNAARDRLVPPDSSSVIALHSPHAIQSTFDTGHIGLFAGGKSKTQVWPHVQHVLTGHNS